MGVVGLGEGCKRREVEEPSIGAGECRSGEGGQASSSLGCQGEGEHSKARAPEASLGSLQPVVLTISQQLLPVALVGGGGAVSPDSI